VSNVSKSSTLNAKVDVDQHNIPNVLRFRVKM
jgi:hypothetical protein